MKMFVAFDTGDEVIARTLVGILRDWFGEKLEITFSAEFVFGVDWRKTLDNAMKNNDALLALCSPRSLNNRWIHFEAGAFYGQNKPVIPVTVGHLHPGDLPEPLNKFQAPNLENPSDIAKLANQIAQMVKLPIPKNPQKAASKIRSIPVTGLPQSEEHSLNKLWMSLQLGPNQRSNEVLSSSNYTYRIIIDDLIGLFISSGWTGLHKLKIKSVIQGTKIFDPEVARVAQKYLYNSIPL